MGRKKRLASWFLTFVLLLGTILPVPISATTLYFTSVNDNLLPLTADNMPVWSSGLLYVPYSVFDSNSSGTDLNLACTYSRSGQTVTAYDIYNPKQMLTFNLNDNTCRNEFSGQYYKANAIMRNGRPYLPLGTVCSFFGLTYSYTSITGGYLVRIKSTSVVLSDEEFIDAASQMFSRRLREYNQSITPSATPSTPSTPSSPSVDDKTSTTDKRTYLAFRFREGIGLDGILDVLDTNHSLALFLLTPQVIESEAALVHRILGSGHSIGILAEGGDLAQTQAILTQGNQLLEQFTHSRTTLAYAPKDQRAALEGAGWVCWRETISLSPSNSVGSITFAANTLRRLEGRSRTTYLTIDGNGNTQRVLPTLLRQLQAEHYVVGIPLETRL